MLTNMPDRRSTVLVVVLTACAAALMSGCGSPATPETDRNVSRQVPTSDQSPKKVRAKPEPVTAKPTTPRDEPMATTETNTTATSVDTTTSDSPSDSDAPTQPSSGETTTVDTAEKPAVDMTSEPKLLPDPPGLKRLSQKNNLWIDPVHKEVVMVAKVVLREGGLELFACLRNTKEHESIVSVDTPAWLVHTGLLAVGAQKGEPVVFRPEYKQATGSRVEVLLQWKDPETGEQRKARAQDWIRNTETGEAMQAYWVFGGSSFWEDEVTNQRYYLAEDGDLICVANFHSAMLDLPIKSTQSNDQLMYDAYTERIPPIGTEVWIRLKPVTDKKEESDSSSATSDHE